MKRRLAQVRSRRERLLARSAAERAELAAVLAPLAGPLAIADRGIAAVQSIRAHPGLVASVAAVVVVVSPRRAFRWARRALVAWRGYRWVARALAELAPRRPRER